MANPDIRFDSNRAWQQAITAIRANREVLLALAGVFFLLPNLAFSLLFPQPTPPAGADQQAMMAFAMDYYSRALPFVLPVLLLQAAGTLGMLTLLTDRSRPTVGQAIRIGFGTVLPYFASQILLGFGLGLAAMPVIIVFSLAGSKGLATIGIAAAIALWAYGWIRAALAAPVMAVEGLRNPVRALTRSWQLTKGNAGRILLFLLLIAIAYSIILVIVMALAGTVLALLLPAHVAALVAAVISTTLGAVMVLTLVAALGATHAQLAADPADRIGTTFD